MHPSNPYIAKRLEEMKTPVAEPEATTPAEAGAEGEEEAAEDGRGPMPICGSSL